VKTNTHNQGRIFQRKDSDKFLNQSYFHRTTESQNGRGWKEPLGII